MTRLRLALCAMIVVTAQVAAAEDRRPKNGDELQAALVAAAPGDRILLSKLATYQREFALPKKPFGPKIVLTTDGAVPDWRIGPADLSLLATISSGVRGSALQAVDGAGGYEITAIHVAPALDGYGANIWINGGTNITLDRILMMGTDEKGQHRCVVGNGTHITLTRSHLSGCWNSLSSTDSQAFVAWDGAGPYLIKDNYLEGGSENVMFGGSASSAEASMPCNITIEDNHIAKPLRWKQELATTGKGRNVKNLFELKAACNVTVRRNLLENVWTDGQSGAAVVFNTMNDDVRSPWSRIENVVFEQNIIRGVIVCIAATGYDSYHPSRQSSSLVFRNNLCTAEWDAVQLSNEIGSAAFDRNTFIHKGTMIRFTIGGIWPEGEGQRLATYAVAPGKFVWTNNVGSYNEYGIWAEGAPPPYTGTTGLNHAAPGAVWKADVVAAVPAGVVMPEGTWAVTPVESAASFVDTVYYVLKPDVAWKAPDGKPVGWTGGTLLTPPPTEPPPDPKPEEPTPPDPPKPPVDTEGPTTSFVSIVRSGNSPNYTVTVRAEDLSGVARVDFYVDEVIAGLQTAPTNVGGATYLAKVFIRTAGTHTVKAIAYDHGGQSSTIVQQVVR